MVGRKTPLADIFVVVDFECVTHTSRKKRKVMYSCPVVVSTVPQISLPMALLQRPMPHTQVPQHLRT